MIAVEILFTCWNSRSSSLFVVVVVVVVGVGNYTTSHLTVNNASHRKFIETEVDGHPQKYIIKWPQIRPRRSPEAATHSLHFGRHLLLSRGTTLKSLLLSTSIPRNYATPPLLRHANGFLGTTFVVVVIVAPHPPHYCLFAALTAFSSR